MTPCPGFQPLPQSLSSSSFNSPGTRAFSYLVSELFSLFFHSSVNFFFWGFLCLWFCHTRAPFLFASVFYLILCSNTMWSGYDPVRPESLLSHYNVTWRLDYSLSASYVACLCVCVYIFIRERRTEKESGSLHWFRKFLSVLSTRKLIFRVTNKALLESYPLDFRLVSSLAPHVVSDTSFHLSEPPEQKSICKCLSRVSQ